MLRFAPSPTEDMHINNLRVAVLNYLVAQQRKLTFTVRIVDGEKEKNIEGKDTEIMQILEKFALTHASVFHQSEHLHMHQTLAIKLLEQGKAFVCSCEDTQTGCMSDCETLPASEHAKLKEAKKPFVIRLKKPVASIVIADLLYGKVTVAPQEIDAFVILQADGTPTKIFASACDDIISGTSTILEEKSHLLTAASIAYIKTQLDYDEKIDYIHIPSLLNAPTILELFEQGYIPDAIINYLLLVGLPKVQAGIFTLPEVISSYQIENLSTSDVDFDKETLRFINRAHLNRMDNKQLSSLFGFADEEVGKLVKLYLEEASTINELALKIRPIFAPKVFEEEWAEQMRVLQKVIADAPMLHSYDDFLSYLTKISGLTDENLLKPLQLLLTGTTHGPELSKVYPLIKSYLLEVAS